VSIIVDIRWCLFQLAAPRKRSRQRDCLG